MQLVQLLPTISYGDAVGNDTLALKKIIQEMGFDTEIYAENIDQCLPAGTAKPVSAFPKLSENDVIVYHGSTGTDLNFELPKLGCRNLMVYHNITPPEFFRMYSHGAERLTSYGLQGVRNLADKVDYCIADSDFNRKDLREMKYNCLIDVCPILIPFEDYEKIPDQNIVRKYEEDGYVNVLFTGRIAPNKKQEDVIRAFYYYHTYYNKKSRLFLVGSWNGMEKYYDRLCSYVKVLGLSDSVAFTGHVKFDEILAYYKVANLFLCMSEHEGFCVPLVEAMYFGIPVIAYRSTAIPDTLGGSGLLLESKEPKTVAAVMHQLISDSWLYQKTVDDQRRRLKDFSYERVKKRFIGLMNGFLENGGLR